MTRSMSVGLVAVWDQGLSDRPPLASPPVPRASVALQPVTSGDDQQDQPRLLSIVAEVKLTADLSTCVTDCRRGLRPAACPMTHHETRRHSDVPEACITAQAWGVGAPGMGPR
jgi:hypothetical protein